MKQNNQNNYKSKIVSLVFVYTLALGATAAIAGEYSTHEAPPDDIDKVDCENAMSTYEVRYCQSEENSAARAEHAWVIENIRIGLGKAKKIEKSEPGYDPDFDYAAESKKRFLASQKVFRDYRNKQCSFESLDMLYGTYEPVIYVGCLNRLLRERTKLLLEMALGDEPTVKTLMDYKAESEKWTDEQWKQKWLAHLEKAQNDRVKAKAPQTEPDPKKASRR